MDARVKQSSRYGTVTAFSGHEYVKYEWRVVPAGKEEEAAKHPHLEVKQIGMDVLNSLPSFSEPAPEPETITEIVEMEPIAASELEPEVKAEEIPAVVEEAKDVEFEPLPEIDQDNPTVERVAKPVKPSRKRR